MGQIALKGNYTLQSVLSCTLRMYDSRWNDRLKIQHRWSWVHHFFQWIAKYKNKSSYCCMSPPPFISFAFFFFFPFLCYSKLQKCLTAPPIFLSNRYLAGKTFKQMYLKHSKTLKSNHCNPSLTLSFPPRSLMRTTTEKPPLTPLHQLYSYHPNCNFEDNS